MTPQELTKAKIDLYGELVRDPRTKAAVLGVAWLLLFKYLHSEKLVAWPAAQTLADDLGGSLRAVRYALDWLTDEGWFSVERSRGRSTSRYAPNFSTVQETAPLTVQPTAPLETSTVQPVAPNRAKTRNSTVQPIAPNTLEEPIEETLEGAHAREASPNGFARDAPLTAKTKKKRSAMRKEDLENALYYRRQELESSGSLKHAMLSDRDRQAADEWLREHGNLPAKPAGNGLDARS